jgi:chromosomal replication initiator protein
MSVSELWSKALQRLSQKVAEQNFDMWLRPIECEAEDGHVLRLRAPNPYVRLWFESNYLGAALEEIRAETGSDYAIEFEADAQPANGPGPANPQMVADPPPLTAVGYNGVAAAVTERVVQPRPVEPEAEAESVVNIPLNPRYNFDTFVAGPSNQLAYAAAQAAASTYPPKYNPVFVCGGVGLGKTHLLHAIGHHILHTRPASRLLYLSGEQFMNEYIHAIRTNQMHKFRRRYREGCDVLLVDDVQFLAGKDGTQDEFFHTFNALHNTHRQIVLTADRKPYEISPTSSRPSSRSGWQFSARRPPPRRSTCPTTSPCSSPRRSSPTSASSRAR